jgi:hypothetical protein
VFRAEYHNTKEFFIGGETLYNPDDDWAIVLHPCVCGGFNSPAGREPFRSVQSAGLTWNFI